MTEITVKVNTRELTRQLIDYHCSSLHVYETDYKQASKVILND